MKKKIKNILPNRKPPQLITSLALLFCTWGYWMQSAQAEGSRNLYPSGATGFRANLEWRSISSSRYGPTTPVDNSLARRTLLQVYAQAGEYILLGSSSVGSGSGDIFIYGSKTGRIGNETLSNEKFRCSTQRTQTANSNQGRITSRNQELAGPDTITNAANATPGNQVSSGYVPCYYQVPAGGDGIYYVAITGSAGFNGITDGNPTQSINLNNSSTFVDQAGTSVAAWDVTVRSSLTSTTDINGRLFADYLALFTGNNGRPVNSTFYTVTEDGYRYQTNLNGLDPNGFVIYGNDIGYYDSDGKTPLYHDVLGSNSLLATLTGGTNLALPNHLIFFNNPVLNVEAEKVLSARNIPTVPKSPSIVSNSFSFTGTAGNNNTFINSTGNRNIVAGTFQFNSTITGIYEIVISKDVNSANPDFDPANSKNRVLRGKMTTSGVQTVNWDGLDNLGNSFPVGTSYPVKVTVHAGEYHFPLIDTENSINGGPSFTLLNANNPLGNNQGFYDDRGYRTLSGMDIGTLDQNTSQYGVLCGGSPPAQPYRSNSISGFNTTTAQRAYGTSTGGNSTTSCAGSFGDAKGLDIWTYIPSQAMFITLNIIDYKVSPQVGKVIINEVLYNETTNNNDEFIELYNPSSSAVDLSGFKLADGNLIANDTDGIGGFNYTFPNGTTLQPGQYAVIWIGSSNANTQATGAAFQAWVGQASPKLNNTGDDVWLYDNQNQIIDYIAYGTGTGINTPPPSSLNLWDTTYQSSLNTAGNGQSISLTRNGNDTNTSACWERTTSNDPITISNCPNYLQTRDTEDTGTTSARITSVGKNNNGTANVLLVKRITRINSNNLTDIVDGRSDVATTANNYVPSPYDVDDNDDKWPNNYLQGQINAGAVKPGDELEYTIYFLSKGGSSATNVKFCDLVPANTTFSPTAFNGLSPNDGGSAGNQGIAMALSSTIPTVYFSNIADGDRATFYSANDPATPSSCGSNTNGAVFVNITKASVLPNLPGATGRGTPVNSYGFIRFRATVK